MLGWQKQRKRKPFAAWAWSESSCRIRKFELQWWWWWFPIWHRHWLISRISWAAPTFILQISPVLHFFGTFVNLSKPLQHTIVSIFSHTFVNILLHWSAYHGCSAFGYSCLSSFFLECRNRKVKKMSWFVSINLLQLHTSTMMTSAKPLQNSDDDLMKDICTGNCLQCFACGRLPIDGGSSQPCR